MTPRPLHTWTSDHFGLELPEHHPFPIAKYPELRARVVAEGLVDAADLHRSEPAPLEWLRLAHDADYVEAATARGIDADAERRLGLPWSASLVARARAATYGTVMAARAACEHGVAGNLAGGSHHAFRDRGEAYCLFNDIAVAIAVLRREGLVERPLVVDLDVHQGNGTAAMFQDDDRVFTLSLHGAGNYPARKERSTLDVALDDDSDDATYLATLDRHWPAALERHAPDLVIYQAGVDALAGDRFGRLALTADGLAARDRRVLDACERAHVPVVVTLGGGYSRPLAASIDAHLGVWRALREARDRRRQ
ncbi:MAG TPA: histone deacetylase [Candidatus Saccharimonadaceae bacterium]|jgi:acetoin utilization deacetylase AcuC-like enzyme|nr:histone deacetylase [Candidatus Saccharimonadaceae bacterium]